MKELSFVQKASALIAKNRTKRAFDRSIMHPERDWVLVSAAFVVIISAGATLSVMNYKQFSSVSLGEGGGEVGGGVYNGAIVQAALDEMDARSSTYQSLVNTLEMGRSQALPEVVIEEPPVVSDVEPAADVEEEVKTSDETEVADVTEEAVIELAP